MSSSTTDVRFTADVQVHVNVTIDLLNSYALGVHDIQQFMYEVVENQCYIFGTNPNDDKFLLYRANISDITEETDLYTPITESIESRFAARKTSSIFQESFRSFQSSLPGGGSSAIRPSLELEHGVNADKTENCHSVQLIGSMNVNGTRYKITFGELVDFEQSRDWGLQMKLAFQYAKDWSQGITEANLSERLAENVDGVKVIRLDEEVRSDESSDGVTPVADDDAPIEMDPSLRLAMQLQEEWDRQDCFGGFDVFNQLHTQRAEPAACSSSSSGKQTESKEKQSSVMFLNVKNDAIKNAEEARGVLEGIVFSTNPYDDRSHDEVFNGIHVDLTPQTMGRDNRFKGEFAKNWSYKVSFGKIYWMLPILNENGVLKSADEILEELKPIAYFGPEINDLLIHWHGRKVCISTEFVTDKEIGDDGVEVCKRFCTIGMFKVDELTCCPLADLSAMKEGDYKVRYELPDDIYKLHPSNLIAGLQQNIHLFVDNMLAATGCSLPAEAPRNDVQTMIEALHHKELRERLEATGAKLRWEIITDKGLPNTFNLYFDIADQSKKGDVYVVFRDFLNEIDFNKRWSFKILEESSLCVQMSWQGAHTEKSRNIVQFIDENEFDHLRQFGSCARQIVADGKHEAIKIDLHVSSKDKLEGAKIELENLLSAVCRQQDEGAEDEATIYSVLDSSVTSHGYRISRPMTLSYSVRTVAGPMGKMINFLKMHSGIPDLKTSVRQSFGGGLSLELEARVSGGMTKEKMAEGLDNVLQNATTTFSDNLWIYEEDKRAPSGTVKYTVELHGAEIDAGFTSLFDSRSSSPTFGGFSSTFGEFSSTFGGFASSRAFEPKPKPTQYDPGYGTKDLSGDDKLKEIFDISDDEL